MKLRTIQHKIREGNYNITDHALLESFKDGVDLDDILHVVFTGEVIESYPSRERVLIFGKTKRKKFLHVVVDYSEDDPEIITAYLPDLTEWIKGRTRQ